MDTSVVADRIHTLSARFASERRERQGRRELDPAGFEALRDCGFPLIAVPAEHGGLFESVPLSTRPIAGMLRTLARGDPSVALVASMHPCVLYSVRWLGPAEASPGRREAWEAQRRWVFGTVKDGAWWGTITSEPGSGGDLSRTRATAGPDGAPGRYRLTGDKHFGSGSGVTSYMITAAVV